VRVLYRHGKAGTDTRSHNTETVKIERVKLY